ncbi:hypothetical protein AAXE64_08035 [Priestia megaterium]
MDLSKNRAWIVDKDKSKEFLELFEAHKNSEKRKKFLDECTEVYNKLKKNGDE